LARKGAGKESKFSYWWNHGGKSQCTDHRCGVFEDHTFYLTAQLSGRRIAFHFDDAVASSAAVPPILAPPHEAKETACIDVWSPKQALGRTNPKIQRSRGVVEPGSNARGVGYAAPQICCIKANDWRTAGRIGALACRLRGWWAKYSPDKRFAEPQHNHDSTGNYGAVHGNGEQRLGQSGSHLDSIVFCAAMRHLISDEHGEWSSDDVQRSRSRA
jgi:hypothetical protein